MSISDYLILSIILFICVLIICTCVFILLAFDALEGEKKFRLEQQADINKQAQFIKMEDGQLKEKFENKNETKKNDVKFPSINKSEGKFNFDFFSLTN